jgi:hypothetical protein
MTTPTAWINGPAQNVGCQEQGTSSAPVLP